MLHVVVHQNNGEAACRQLKRLGQFNLILKKYKMSTAFEPPSRKRARKKQESARRISKNNYRKRVEAESN